MLEEILALIFLMNRNPSWTLKELKPLITTNNNGQKILRSLSLEDIYRYRSKTKGLWYLSLDPEKSIEHLGGWMQNRLNRQALSAYSRYAFYPLSFKIFYDGAKPFFKIRYVSPPIPDYAPKGLEVYVFLTPGLKPPH